MGRALLPQSRPVPRQRLASQIYWGNLIASAQDHFIRYPWLAIFPGLMIFISIISVNCIGDGLRDAFDPYKVLETVGKYL